MKLVTERAVRRAARYGEKVLVVRGAERRD
jgi:hypothetical protein